MKKVLSTILVSACAVVMLAGCGKDKVELDESQVRLGEYKGIELTDTGLVEVTDEDVDNEIYTMLQYMTEAVEVTSRPVQLGDYINCDYSGKVDGELFDGGTAENQPLLIGSGTMIDGFEDAIIGMEIGETKDFTVTFPEAYRPEGDPAEHLNGAEAVFTVTVNSITEYIVPELTEELVGTLSETATTIEEYEAEVRVDLEERNAEARQEALRNEAWAKVVESAEVVELPQDKVDEILADIRTQYEEEAESNEIEFAEFIELSLGLTEEEFDEQAIEVAEYNTKQQVILKLLAQAAGIDPTEEECDAIYEELIVGTTFETIDDLKETIDADTLEIYVLNDLVLDWLVENATIVESEAQTEETAE